MGFVDQKPAKLLAAKVGVLKEKSATSVIPPELCAISFGLGLMPGPLQSFSKFDASNFRDPKFSALKDLNPFKTVSKVQEAIIILRVTFVLSK